MDFTQTKKGLLRAEFRDRYGQKCSIQESSFPDEACLWLGVDVGQDGQEVRHGRMHLSQELAHKLLPMLRHFVRQGTLGLDAPKDQFRIGAWVVGVGEENHGVEGRIIYVQNGEMMVVQDNAHPGDGGHIACTWEVADLIWSPIEVPDHIPTRFERIMENALADDD